MTEIDPDHLAYIQEQKDRAKLIAQQLKALPDLMEQARKFAKIKKYKQKLLFPPETETQLPDLTEREVPDILQAAQWEKEAIGTNLYFNPFSLFVWEISHTIVQAKSAENETNVHLGGIIETTKIITDRRKQKMAFFRLVDPTETIECIAFSMTYRKFSDLVKENIAILVDGKIDGSRGINKLNVIRIRKATRID